jgi:hypothetical protein
MEGRGLGGGAYKNWHDPLYTSSHVFLDPMIDNLQLRPYCKSLKRDVGLA